MAIFSSGPLIGEIRGSEGGTTFSRNRFGQYTRQRSVPVNPRTGRQVSARTRFGSAADVWSIILTEAQRDAWRLFGNNISWLNALGQPVSLPGFQHFVREASAFSQAGVPLVSDGPVIFSLPEADPAFAVSVQESLQNIAVTFDDTRAWVDEDDAFMSIHMHQPRGSGREFIGPPSRFAGVLLGDAITPLTSPQLVSVPYAVATGQNTIVSYRIGRADGRMSNLFQAAATVIA